MWFIPRLAEIVPEFSTSALGAAELFGRFVFPDAKSFAAMDARCIEGALRAACVVATKEQLRALREAFLTHV